MGSFRGPNLVCNALKRLSENSEYYLEHQSTDPKDILRCYPRNSKDGQIDWTKDALSIHRLVNASGHPFPGAFTHLNGEKIIIWDTAVAEYKFDFCAIPGQITERSLNLVEVACGSGKLQIYKMEREADQSSDNFEIIQSLRQRFE